MATFTTPIVKCESCGKIHVMTHTPSTKCACGATISVEGFERK